MMKRLLLPLLFLSLATPAQALKLIVWDSEMQTKLGAGESSGSRFNVQLVRDYSGPVRVIFSQSSEEKARNIFAGLQSSYDGLLKNGQLSLLTDPEDSPPTSLVRMAAPQGGGNGGGNGSLTLGKFLQQYRLSLATQATGQSSNLLDTPSPVVMMLSRTAHPTEPKMK